MTSPARTVTHTNGSGSRQRLSVGELETLKAAHPIVEVAAAYGLDLASAGSRLVGLCPLHDETHPSFTLYPDAGRFYCFGCRQGGDVIDLVRLLDGVGFREALDRLQGGLPLSPRQRMEARRRNVVLADRPARSLQARQSPEGRAALEIATALYQQELEETGAAQRYLVSRGIDADLAQTCRLGYCTGNGLVAALRREGVPLRAALEVGLLVGREGHERFAGRISIPEVRNGQPVWLIGRLVDERTDAPRYMSLPGPRPLLGLEQIAGRAAVVGTEGVFDWLTLVGWGLPAFATIGTALPAKAVEELAAARAIYLAFDRDRPGRAAARALAGRLGGRVRLVTLPQGIKDVNELGQLPDGAARFRACLRQAARAGQADRARSADSATRSVTDGGNDRMHNEREAA